MANRPCNGGLGNGSEKPGKYRIDGPSRGGLDRKE